MNDIFEFRKRLIDGYRSFSTSFANPRSRDISDVVNRAYQEGTFWPDPLIQINPNYKRGSRIDELAAEGSVEPETAEIFQVGKQENPPVPVPIRLYKHQMNALAFVANNKSYVVTTGTGSGKSLTFFIPIVNRIIKEKKSDDTPRIRAVIVYPMNALANSQMEEINKFLNGSTSVRVARYTGQDEAAERAEIKRNPPDILLTNYVMLDLILTRYHEDHAIVEAAQGLEFLVLDELHTYRGRQGADVAMLVRRIRAQLNAENLLCIGTSATMASVGSTEDRQSAVARVASKIFDAQIPAANVVMEELEYATGTLSDEAVKSALPSRIAQSVQTWSSLSAFRDDPLAVWIERRLGIKPNDVDGNLERARPQTLETASQMLAEESGCSKEQCAQALRMFLEALHAKTDWPDGRPPFAFKLHQFISGPSQVLATLEPIGKRIVTLDAQRFAPGTTDKLLFTTHFCRFCGEEYIPVWYNTTETGAPVSVEPRPIDETARGTTNESGGTTEFGFLCPAETLDGESVFSTSFGAAPLAIEDCLPDEWFTIRKGERVLSDTYRDRVPRPIRILPNGMISATEGTPYWFLPGKHAFCLQCGQTHAAYGRDTNRLVGLSGEGRSSATTILTLSALNLMYELNDGQANKLLGFTDNRQDAALQSGHFNEFVFAVTLRAALLRALQCAEEQRLGSDEVATAVFAALGFKSSDQQVLSEYLENPELTGAFLLKAQKALRYMLGYRLHEDLGREWRFNNPNLEQLRLVEIKYLGLNELVTNEAKMAENPILAALDVGRRRQFVQIVFDHLRKSLCIRSEYFDPEEQERVRKGGNAYLVDAWRLPSERDHLASSKSLVIFRNRREDLKQNDLTKNANRQLEKGDAVSGSFQSRFFRALVRGESGNGKSLWSGTPFTGEGNAKSYMLRPDTRDVLLDAAITVLKAASTGLVELSNIGTDTVPVWKCELCAEAVIWSLRESASDDDDTRRADGSIRNRYFKQLYGQVAQSLGKQGDKIYTYESHEHTAQVEPELREMLELRFRNKTKDQEEFKSRYPDQRFKPLPVLYCSPTMELGVDISTLDMVYMRNVPPTPANYAQRSGRAGRSGQAALVVTYCTSLSPHDQWFFQHMEDMVHGEVCVPALDLGNQELIESHLRSVWLSCVKKELPVNISELLQVEAAPALLMKTEITDAFAAPDALAEAKKLGKRIMTRLADTEYKKIPVSWYGPDFVDTVIDAAPENFNRALDRWRTLYLATQEQIQKSAKIVANPAASPADRDRAGRVLNDAKNQLNVLLCQRDGAGSASAKNRDFYLYRYLASEGTLPGYSFPRLPVTAWIPRVHSTAGRTKSSEVSNGTMISRPRFLALSEFGPLSFIYHEGHMFQVKRVKLRAAEVQAGEGGSFTIGTKNVRVCPKCGHGHFANENDCGVSNCKNCGESLSGVDTIKMLYQVNAVEAWNKERISLQDEERQRRGYDLMTTYDFEAKTPYRVEVAKGTDGIASLVYCPTANISRINLGWRRRVDKSQFGFWMDPTNGEWIRAESTDDDDGTSASGDGTVTVNVKPVRIVPFVNDHRNVLIFTPPSDIVGDAEAVATLIAALTRGIAQTFQLESGEVAAEPVPNAAHPEKILIYEASEGGAGALGRLVYDPDRSKVLAQIAKSALETMHYHLEDGQWLENQNHCEAGCYKCLLSYYNQPQHERINRRNANVLDYLKKLAKIEPEDYHECAASSGNGIPAALDGAVAWDPAARVATFAAAPSAEVLAYCEEHAIDVQVQGA